MELTVGAPPSVRRWQRPLWLVRLLHWEYWNFYVFYLPVFAWIALLALRARSLLFFTAANPAIPAGGMAGESKRELHHLLPAEYLPQTLFLAGDESLETVLAQVQAAGMEFPLIAKPDVGERGRLVEKLAGPEQLAQYLKRSGEPTLLQAYVDLPLELGVLYMRHPDAATGYVTSVVVKELLTAVGDGHTTLGQWVGQNDRARFQLARLRQEYGAQWERVLAPGERLELVSIGNHSRGTLFRSGQHLLGPMLDGVFDQLCTRIPGFYVGRLDIRTASVEALLRGDFVVLELNGVASEPAHIYDPDMPLWNAWRDLFVHWHHVMQISVANLRRGTPALSWGQFWQLYRRYRKAHSPR